jgi:hypothetical protein
MSNNARCRSGLRNGEKEKKEEADDAIEIYQRISILTCGNRGLGKRR